jgi:hypothetical protein
MRANKFTNKDLNRITKRVLNEAYIDSFSNEIYMAVYDILNKIINISSYSQQLTMLKKNIKSLDWANDETNVYRYIGTLFIDPIKDILFSLVEISTSIYSFEHKNIYEGKYLETLLRLVTNVQKTAGSLVKCSHILANKIVDNYINFQNNILHIYAGQCDKIFNKLKVAISDLHDFLERELKKSSYDFYDLKKMN